MSTALFRHLAETYPDARFTVVCGTLAAEVLAPMPGLEAMEVIGRHRLKVPVRRMLGRFALTRWDLVVDLKNTLVSRIVRAPRVLVHRRPPPGLTTHAALSVLLGTQSLPRPALWFDEALLETARRLVPEGRPVLALGIGASNPNRYWPPSHHAEIVRRFRALHEPATRPLIMVLGHSGESALADAVLRDVPEDQRLDLTRTVPTILGQCACLARAELFVGNDSGFMHAAGALGLPTVGLFGISDPDVFGPFYADWRPVSPGGRAASMADLDVERVWAEVVRALPVPKPSAAARSA